MTQRIRFAVVAACLALAAGACKGDNKDKPKEPAAKTTEQPVKPPEPEPKTTAELAAEIHAGFEALNAGDMDAFGKHYADGATLEFVGSGQPVAQGRDAVLAAIGVFRTAFPDLKGERQLVLASGNRVVSVDLMYGTNSGELMGMPATNKKMGLMVLHSFELDEQGKITKQLAYYDQGTMMGQLGAAEMPHRAAGEPSGSHAEAIVSDGGDQEKANLDVITTADAQMNEHNLDGVLNIMADDVVLSDFTMPADVEGKAGIEKMFGAWTKAFPDLKGETEWSMAAGDYVVRAMTMTATNKGPMPEFGLKKATNKSIEFRFVDVMLVEDGKMKHGWTYGNGMAVAIQLGLVEPPAPPKPE